MEHLYANNCRVLGHSVLPPGDCASNVRAVAVHVDKGRVGISVVAEMHTALEVVVVFPASRVDHVSVRAGASGGVVDIVGGGLALVGEVAQAPGR